MLHGDFSGSGVRLTLGRGRRRRTEGDELHPQVSAILSSDPYIVQSVAASSPLETHSQTYQRVLSRRDFATEQLGRALDKVDGARRPGEPREPLWTSHQAVWDRAKEAWTAALGPGGAPKPPAPLLLLEDQAGGGAGEGSGATEAGRLAAAMARAEKAEQARGRSSGVPGFVSESAGHLTKSQLR
jgi:hypothetical protein